MPILLEPDAHAARVLAAACGAEAVGRPDDFEQRLRRHADHAAVLGPGLDLSLALTTAERVRLAHPTTTVVLVREQIQPDLYALALHAGVGAVVPAGDPEALDAALTRARTTWEALSGGALESRQPGRVITVFSPKGGVGKTTMTVNTALALRGLGSRVCIVDLDLAFGDVAITMQLIPTHTIADAAGLEEHLDWSMLRSLLTEHPGGLSVLAAPTNPEGRERISATLVRRVIAVLREQFDHVVVDTPPGFDDQVLGAFDETDEIMVVATLDVPTIKNVKVALETLDLLHMVRDHRHLVLNRADEEVGLTAANVEDLLGTPVDLRLPSDRAVASATNHGDPIVSSEPAHPVSQAIAGFCAGLAGVAATGPEWPAESPRRVRRFGRRKEAVR